MAAKSATTFRRLQPRRLKRPGPPRRRARALTGESTTFCPRPLGRSGCASRRQRPGAGISGCVEQSARQPRRPENTTRSDGPSTTFPNATAFLIRRTIRSRLMPRRRSTKSVPFRSSLVLKRSRRQAGALRSLLRAMAIETPDHDRDGRTTVALNPGRLRQPSSADWTPSVTNSGLIRASRPRGSRRS